MTLTEFVLARIAEDEAGAPMVALATEWRRTREDAWSREALPTNEMVTVRPADVAPSPRLLAECEAKRRIVALHSAADGACETCYIYAEGVSDNVEACPTLRALALPYANHPDYREEWKP